MVTLRIHRGREKQLRRFHPWVLPGSIASVADEPSPPGVATDIARVVDSSGDFIAYGWYSAGAHTPCRLVSWDERGVPDDAWLGARIGAAIARRESLAIDSDAARLVFGEADGIPGLVVDRFAGYLVVQVSSAGAVARLDAIVASLEEALHPEGIRVQTDATQRALDDLPVLDRWDRGNPPSTPLEIREGARRYRVDLDGGQKTGFYLDQRENRALLARYANGRRVLDAFSYSGGFAIACETATECVCVDSSAAAGELVAQNARLNENGRISFVHADVFSWLREEHAPFDLLIVDPPKMARGARDRDRALRAYKDLVLHALRHASQGALLALFSCSAAIGADDLATATAWGAMDAGRSARSIAVLGQAPDHPVPVSFPEARYLSGHLFQVD